MRTRTAFKVALASLTAASLTFIACSKKEDEEEKDEGTLSTEQKSDANKAAAAQTAKQLNSAQEGANLTKQNVAAQIRALYTQAKIERRQMLALQGEGEGETTDPTMDFDICSLLTSSCEERLNQAQPADEFGATCKTTSCTGGTTDTCTSPSETAQCGDVTYTFAESVTSSTMVCAKTAEKQYNLKIAANFAGSLSGGTITTPVRLECKINIDFPLNFTQEQDQQDEGETELSCEDGQFSCSIDGQELSCADLKAAVADKSCG